MVNDFLGHYAEILADPAHLAVEITLQVIVDGLLLGVVWPFVKRHIHADIAAEHKILDAEHGITHHETTVTRPPESTALDARTFVYDHSVHGL